MPDHELTPDAIADRILWCEANGEPIRAREAAMLARAWKDPDIYRPSLFRDAYAAAFGCIEYAMTNSPVYHLCDA